MTEINSMSSISTNSFNPEFSTNDDTQQKTKSLITIFNTDDNKNELSVSEQQAAYESKLTKYKNLLKNNEYTNIITDIFSKLKAITFNNSNDIERQVAESNLRGGIIAAEEQMLNVLEIQTKREAIQLKTDCLDLLYSIALTDASKITEEQKTNGKAALEYLENRIPEEEYKDLKNAVATKLNP